MRLHTNATIYPSSHHTIQRHFRLVMISSLSGAGQNESCQTASSLSAYKSLRPTNYTKCIKDKLFCINHLYMLMNTEYLIWKSVYFALMMIKVTSLHFYMKECYYLHYYHIFMCVCVWNMELNGIVCYRWFCEKKR